jgi:hypothetical protein
VIRLAVAMPSRKEPGGLQAFGDGEGEDEGEGARLYARIVETILTTSRRS